MRAYQQERVENAICYFAGEHRKRTHRYISQTELYKYLAFFDFRMLEATGRAPLDLEYEAMDYGPVPVDIYRNRFEQRSALYRFEKQQDNIVLVKASSKPDLDYFSAAEQTEMDNLVVIFATPGMKARTMSAASHGSIRAWRLARERQSGSPLIDKADTFPGLAQKSEGELTSAEERFLMADAIRKVGA